MARRKRPAAALVSDVALEDMTSSQLRAKAAATPGVSVGKNVDGKWVPKKKAEMVADLTAFASTSSGKATVSDRSLEDMTHFQLRAHVAATPGVSSAKKVDGKWLSKKKAEMVADVTGKATFCDGALEDMTYHTGL